MECLLVLYLLAPAWLVTAAETAALDAQKGQPANIAASAYLYRADRPALENPPEAEFLFVALKHDEKDALAGLLWEEPRPVTRVVLRWPAEARRVPRSDRMVLRWFPEGSSASWWCRDGDGTKLREARGPSVSADGRTMTFTLDATSNAAALDNLVVAVDSGRETIDSPMVEVLVPQTWKRMDVLVELGFQEGTEKLQFDGCIEAYNGILGKVAPLAGDRGTRSVGHAAWESQPTGQRRGVTAQLLYVGYQDTRVWPGQAKIEDANRTVITVRTKAGSFSLPADLERGPILASEYGFYVAATPGEVPAADFRRDLRSKGLKTLRQQIRDREEQSWENVMRAVHSGIRGDFPPYPPPKVSAAMEVEVPQPYLTAAWKMGATNLLRNGKKDPRGKWRFRDLPYDALAHETHLFLRVLDLMGMHREARDGYEMWLERAEKPVPLPDGLWQGGPAAFFSGIEWDTAHGGGISVIHLDMLGHYLLTRDREWLKANTAKLNANADWMITQRKKAWAAIPGRERLWTHGLLPPHNIWDSRRWRSWYESNSSYCQAVLRHAEIIAQVDAEAGRRFAAEGQESRKDLLAAVEKSLTLSPVVRVRDGTYRSFLPPTPYMRGPASRFMPTEFGGMHSPGLYPDAIRGGQHVAEFGLLPASDPRMQGYLDVLEDRLLSENFKIAMRFPDYDSEKDWFSRSGWYYQCGLERTANIHLQWDDPACFLRTWLNQYAIEIIPGPWTFREHTAAHPCMDKPFEEAAFLERFRMMLVMEEGEALCLARATPRAWLAQGQKIRVQNAPTDFGVVEYEIVSDVEHGRIVATVKLPSRNPPREVRLRLRHPKGAPIKSVTVGGREWKDFDVVKELIRLHDVGQNVVVEARY